MLVTLTFQNTFTYTVPYTTMMHSATDVQALTFSTSDRELPSFLLARWGKSLRSTGILITVLCRVQPGYSDIRENRNPDTASTSLKILSPELDMTLKRRLKYKTPWIQMGEQDCPGEPETNFQQQLLPFTQSPLSTLLHFPDHWLSLSCTSAGIRVEINSFLQQCDAYNSVQRHNSLSDLHCGLRQRAAASWRASSSVTVHHSTCMFPARQGTAQGGSGQTSPLPVSSRDAQHHTWHLLKQEGNTKKAPLKGASLKVNRQVQHREEHRAWGRGRVEHCQFSHQTPFSITVFWLLLWKSSGIVKRNHLWFKVQFSSKSYVKLPPSYSEPLGTGNQSCWIGGAGEENTALSSSLVSPTGPTCSCKETSKCCLPELRRWSSTLSKEEATWLSPSSCPGGEEIRRDCLGIFAVKKDSGRMLQPCSLAMSPLRFWLTRSWSIWDYLKACVHVPFCVCLSL